MMKKLLYQFDTDTHPSVFDNVVGYDGGADHISAYGGVNAANVGGLVEGAIFTRSPKDKKNTAIFIGGSNMPQGEAVLAATRAKFFAKFRVSVMFDCNGSNTTAAAAVAWLAHGRSLRGKRAVVLAGSGPVGQRAAVLLAREGAQVAITGRKLGGSPGRLRRHQRALWNRSASHGGANPPRAQCGAPGRAHCARDGRLRHNAAGSERLAGKRIAGADCRCQRLAACRH